MISNTSVGAKPLADGELPVNLVVDQVDPAVEAAVRYLSLFRAIYAN
jgi:hypothetical protein